MSSNYEELAERAKNLNQQIIKEFRENGGKIANFPGPGFLLLHTHGAKSNQERVVPLRYFKEGDNYVLVVANGGAPTNPDWYYNILAHPDDVTIEVGTEQFNVHATLAEPTERNRIFAEVTRQAPDFAKHQNQISRIIPIVLLERVNKRD